MEIIIAVSIILMLLAAFVAWYVLTDRKLNEEHSLCDWADKYLKEGKITTRQYNEFMFGGLLCRSGIPKKRKYYKYAYVADYGETVLVNITKEITSSTLEQVLDTYRLDDLYTKSLQDGSKAIALGTLYCRSDRYKLMTEKQFKRELDIEDFSELKTTFNRVMQRELLMTQCRDEYATTEVERKLNAICLQILEDNPEICTMDELMIELDKIDKNLLTNLLKEN